MKTETVTLGPVVPGGQTLSELSTGRKVFVWGGLPGETVKIRVTKKKRGWGEAVVEELIGEAHPARVEPRDEAYLSTSPWQIYDWRFENSQKQQMLSETFRQFDIDLDFTWRHDNREFGYRNKMEFSFWWEEDTGVQLAFYKRGSKQRQQVEGSSLAMPAINKAAQSVLKIIHKHQLDGRQLKSLIVRAAASGRVAAVLYVKDKSIPSLFEDESELHDIPELDALHVAYSDPQSPASTITPGKYQSYGAALLVDKINDKEFQYMPYSFFQVNIPMFEEALQDIAKHKGASERNVTDLYSGVGSIGLNVGADVLVEIDPASSDWAVANAKAHGNDEVEVIHASAEKSLDYIKQNQTLIVDPPRAGLHKNITQAITEVKPEKLIYLSCNPSTQARDVNVLLSHYKITQSIGYNFFPKTPHIESLIVLERK